MPKTDRDTGKRRFDEQGNITHWQSYLTLQIRRRTTTLKIFRDIGEKFEHRQYLPLLVCCFFLAAIQTSQNIVPDKLSSLLEGSLPGSEMDWEPAQGPRVTHLGTSW